MVKSTGMSIKINKGLRCQLSSVEVDYAKKVQTLMAKVAG